ncbi:cytochrome P450 [Streptomyces sp. GMY02]|uniref:cytochrome P450 n=1 Tax=Streptomyces sp. GMY02 TaxID=1333528 RepID=UPI001C2BF370|nr:cytochrome P450 [Streptomyces sp. GMY02]QXE38424.1 cytochrome P450 [Streptomyces sp. GMY02]
MITEPDNGLPQVPAARTCPFSPPREYALLREAGPVTQVALPGDKHAWAVTTLAAVRELLTRPDISSNPQHPNFPEPFPDVEAEEAPDDAENAAAAEEEPDEEGGGEPLPQLIEMDPPLHTVYRRMLIPELTVKRVKELRPGIQQLVDGLIDDMLAKGPTADLVSAYSLAIPSAVICQLLGISNDSHHFFQTRTETVVSRAATSAEKLTAYMELYSFLDVTVTAKETEPTDDILGRLVTKYFRTGELSHEMLVSTAVLLLLAGHETTANTISLGVLAFLQYPEQLQALREDPAAAVNSPDEMVRFQSLGDVDISRTATADFDFQGTQIKNGDGLLPIISVANRDPEAFDHPDELDIRREDTRHHVGFGYGPHQCLGQNLARVELEIAYRTLFERIPGLRLAVPLDEIRFKNDSQIFGVHSMPVTW